MHRARRPSKALTADRLRGAAARGDAALAARELEKGVDVDEEDEQSGTVALHEAAECNHPAVVDLLVRANASVDLRDARGWTALMKASKLGHADALRILLRAGADIGVEADGRTAADWAAMGGHDAASELLAAASAGELPAAPKTQPVPAPASPAAAVEPAASEAEALPAPDVTSATESLQREVRQLHQRLGTMQAQLRRTDAAAAASAASAASQGALHYVAQLSERLAHLEGVADSYEQRLAEEIERLHSASAEQTEQLSLVVQLNAEKSRSGGDATGARVAALAAQLQQVQGTVREAASGMNGLRQEFEEVRDAGEESAIAQSVEMAAMRAAVEVEREARQYECAELATQVEDASLQTSRLREGLGLGPDSAHGAGRAALAAFLEAAELSHYLEVMEEVLGAAMVEDLLEMEDEDFDMLGLKKLERKRLLRAVARLRSTAGRGVASAPSVPQIADRQDDAVGESYTSAADLYADAGPVAETEPVDVAPPMSKTIVTAVGPSPATARAKGKASPSSYGDHDYSLPTPSPLPASISVVPRSESTGANATELQAQGRSTQTRQQARAPRGPPSRAECVPSLSLHPTWNRSGAQCGAVAQVSLAEAFGRVLGGAWQPTCPCIPSPGSVLAAIAALAVGRPARSPSRKHRSATAAGRAGAGAGAGGRGGLARAGCAVARCGRAGTLAVLRAGGLRRVPVRDAVGRIRADVQGARAFTRLPKSTSGCSQRSAVGVSAGLR